MSTSAPAARVVRLKGDVILEPDDLGGGRYFLRRNMAILELNLFLLLGEVSSDADQVFLTTIAQLAPGMRIRVDRDQIEPAAPEDGPYCARCGCCEQVACPGGCFWTEDPTRPGADVCNRCRELPDLAD